MHAYDILLSFLQKIVLNESRQSQFMLWKVKKDTFWRHILDEMYHAALNLSIRIIEVCIIWTAKKFCNLFHLISAIIVAFITHLKRALWILVQHSTATERQTCWGTKGKRCAISDTPTSIPNEA